VAQGDGGSEGGTSPELRLWDLGSMVGQRKSKKRQLQSFLKRKVMQECLQAAVRGS
jgi:hypothetical protein